MHILDFFGRLIFTLLNQTFDHLMASPSIEFSAAQWKRLCCDAELKGLRFDSSRRLRFFFVTPRDDTNTSFFNLFLLPFIISPFFLSPYTKCTIFFHRYEPIFFWRVASLQKYTIAYHRRILKKRLLFSLWCIGQILAQFAIKLEGWILSTFRFWQPLDAGSY